MSKDIAGRKKITALTRASLLLILTFLFSPSFSENLLKCPDFEQPDSLSQCWTHLSWGSSDVSAQIVTGGYQNSNGLMMLNNDPCLICEYTRQMVGSLEPGLYGLSVLYKTSPECQAMAYIRNTGQLNIGKSKALNGTGSWNNLNVHFAVRDEYADQTWQVMLYGGLPPNSKEPVYYDKAVFEKLSLTQIEEINIGYWEKMIFRFTNGFPPLKWVPAKVSTCSAASDPNIHGEYALVLKGTKTTKELYEFDVPVRPSTKYKVGVSVKYMNRKSYNYLQSIPAYPSDYTRPFSSTLEGTKGIWSGFYDVRVYDKSLGRSYAASVLQPVISDAIYVADANRDWFSEKSYYQTGPNSSNLTMQIELTGFDGDLYIDDLTVEEVHSHIEDESLRIPISYEYEGMKITGWTLPSIKTNAAEFIFNASSIWLAKGSNVLGYLTFNSNFLASLAVDTTASGLVILKNGNITVSIGADSSMIVRLEKDTNVTVSGVMPPKFHNFDAGAVFVSDYEKGFLFSPVFPDLNIRTMGRLLNPPYANADVNILDFRYSDNDIDAIGLKCWDNRPVFTNPIWKVTYRFTAGDGFLASVFPPKDFNYKKYASERMHAAFDLNLNIFPNGDYRYLLTKFRERFNILLLWMGSYNLSSPHPACPMVYYTDSNGVAVSPVAPNAAPVKFIHNDVAGPYKVSQPAALDDVVARARNMGLRIILYMSPNYFYTSDLDTFFENLTAIINRYNLDGVYFDGYVSGSPLKTLELVRKARNILKNKYYAQHSSWTNTLIYQSDHFRVPFYDAYADLIYTGENLRKDYSGDTKTWDLACQPDPNAWALLYCGRNLSNTPTVLIGEYRPVDYSNLNTGPDLTLSPRTQMDYQLKYQGIFRVWPFTSYCSINDFLYRKTLSFDSSGWWKSQITQADRRYEKFIKSADESIKVFNGIKEIETLKDAPRRLNVWWYCVNTLLPAYYSSTPKAEVNLRKRAGGQPYELGSVILERNTQYSMDCHFSFDKVGYNAALQFLLTGQAVLWARYAPKFEKVFQEIAVIRDPSGALIQGDGTPYEGDTEGFTEASNGILIASVEVEQKVSEKAVLEVVQFSDYRCSDARNESEVEWQAKRAFLDRDEATALFGEEKADKLNYDSVPAPGPGQKDPGRW